MIWSIIGQETKKDPTLIKVAETTLKVWKDMNDKFRTFYEYKYELTKLQRCLMGNYQDLAYLLI